MPTASFRSRFSPLIVLSAFYLCASFLLRLVLWFALGWAEGLRAALLPAVLVVGLVSDLIALAYLTLPFTLIVAFTPERLFQSSFFRRLTGVVSFLLIYSMLYLSVVEFYFFEEFDSRFNLVAVDYLIYPHEVFVNLWDSYPIVWYLFGTAILSAAVLALLWPMLMRFADKIMPLGRRAAIAGGLALAAAAFALAIPTERIEFSSNRLAVEIGSNGISSLFRAFRTEELDFNLYYRTLPREQAFKIVREDLANAGGSFASPDLENLNRTFPAKTAGLGKMNVVILCEESLGSEFVGAFGGRNDLTPNLDRLAQKSLVFSSVYASGSRTVRGLEAISASFPPIPSVSIMRRPGNENIATIGQLLQNFGYHTSFLYGGYGLFDNMNYFFGNNGFAISDRSDIEHPRFGNIWGVADDDLYNHAIAYIDSVASDNKPFFSLIMSTSNHKPFTFPDGVPGVPPSKGGRDAGVRFSDYAIAKFLKDSESHSWFKDTLFMVVADHDARVYGRQEIPFKRFRVPLMIYSPAHLQPMTVDKPISQIDIAPTIMGLLGLEYTAPFYGRDALAGASEHPIFVNHYHEVAFMLGAQVVILGLGKGVKTFRHVDGSDDLVPDPLSPELVDRATAYYQTAFDLFRSRQYAFPFQRPAP